MRRARKYRHPQQHKRQQQEYGEPMCTSSIHIANIAQTRHKPQLCRLFPKESVGLFRVFPIPYDSYPQRQQITGNTAGVEWGRMENTAQGGLSKWALRDSFTTTAANHRKHCRCGMGPNGEYGSERLVEGGTARETYHNGSKSREMLPVWQGVFARTYNTSISD